MASRFPRYKVPLLFDIRAVDPDSPVDQLITQKHSWCIVKLASVFHPSLVNKILSVPLRRRFSEDLVL